MSIESDSGIPHHATASLWRDAATAIDTDDFEPGASYDEVIVGAGITGLVTALLLARQGRRVAVLEARDVGAGTTGNTTAKVTTLQGIQYQRVLDHGYRSVLEAYADANRHGFEWLLNYVDTSHVAVERKTAVTYAGTPDGRHLVEREHELARSVGLDVRLSADAGLPFPTFAAVTLADQAQLDPMELLAALTADVRALGGVVAVGVRVTGVRASRPAVVRTSRGDVRAGHVVLATGTPILNRGLYFIKASAHRSYAQAFTVPGDALPPGMYLNVERSTRSVRTANGLLLTGGNGHAVGREPSPQARAEELTRWTQEHWPGAELTHAWAAQDYSAAHHVPFVGWLPRGRGRIFLATGYDKWGMTNSVAAALTIVADLHGESSQWQRALHQRVTMPRALARGVGANAAVAWWYAKGYAGALGASLPSTPPAEGTARVGRYGLRPVAESTVDGVTCRVSAVCAHLGGIVTWNDAERSWDCPAHGSRYAADGTRLEGPTTRDLKRLEPSTD